MSPFLHLNCASSCDLRRRDTGLFLTIRTLRSAGALSHFEPGRLMPILSPLGQLIDDKLHSLAARSDGGIRLDSYAIMPDHVHACLYQVTDVPRTPLQYLTSTFSLIEHEASNRWGVPAVWDRPGEIFVCYSREKYNEKNNYTRGNINRFHLDNEARHLGHPHPVAHPALDPRWHWTGHGDIRLLDRADRLPVHVSRHATDEDVALFTRLATRLASEGWVLVGGFVSPRERALLRAVRESSPQACVIHLLPTRLLAEKPTAQQATLLFSRRLLRLTSTDDEACQRETCLRHNQWIETFCGNWREAVIVHFRSAGIAAKGLSQTRAFLERWNRT